MINEIYHHTCIRYDSNGSEGLRSKNRFEGRLERKMENLKREAQTDNCN